MDDLFMIDCFYHKVTSIMEEYFSDKMNILLSHLQYLHRIGIIVEDPNDEDSYILGKKGESIYEEIISGPNFSVSVKTNNTSIDVLFEDWWKLYPATDDWKDDNNKHWIGTRGLKTKKAECKKKYLKILNQGISHEQMCGALKYEIKTKKEQTVKTNDNKMQYFKGIEAYLNAQTYNSWIEMYKNNPNYIEDTKIRTRQNVTDI